MILLSDANVLIDLGFVGGLPLLPRIAPTEVLDVVLLECEHERQPGLVQAVLDCGIKQVTTETAWERAARRLRTPELSLQDALNLHYARAFNRVLLAGDMFLRNQGQALGIEVHGSIWLVAEAYARKLVPPEDLCHWLGIWPSVGRRLPKPDLARLKKQLGY